MDNSIFDHLKRISETKEELLDYKPYNPFMINRFLSMRYDSVLYAQEMTKLFQLPKKFQFIFLKETLPAKRRFFKYYKKGKNESEKQNIQDIKEYYGISEKKASEYMEVLKSEDIMKIKKKLNKGGKSSKVIKI